LIGLPNEKEIRMSGRVVVFNKILSFGMKLTSFLFLWALSVLATSLSSVLIVMKIKKEPTPVDGVMANVSRVKDSAMGLFTSIIRRYKIR
jgi:vacuolar-type H+-ATPase subunit I/STV1